MAEANRRCAPPAIPDETLKYGLNVCSITMRNTTEKRPWLAVFLAALGTGLRHLYLCR
jgi:hypothetical protein